MRVISAIDDRQVIRAILEYLGLWLDRSKPPPKAHAPPILKYAAYDLQFQTHAKIMGTVLFIEQFSVCSSEN